MNDQFTSILTQCIDNIERGEMTPEECIENYPQYGDELADLLGMMHSIKTTSHEPVDEAFCWRTRASLVNKVISHQPVTIWDKPQLLLREIFSHRSRVPRMQIVLIVTLLLSLLSGGSVLAAENAVPGDLLYPLKMFVEEMRIAIFGEDKDTELHLQFAEKRLREVELLAEKGRFEGIGMAIDRFEHHIKGVERSIPAGKTHEDILRYWRMYELCETIFKHQEVLERLLDDEVVAEEARVAIEHAIEASAKGQTKLNELFPEGPPVTPPLEFVPIPDDLQPQGEPELPESSGIPELPVELPFDPDVIPTDQGDELFPLPVPVVPPGRP
jgi:hypothetical protein